MARARRTLATGGIEVLAGASLKHAGERLLTRAATRVVKGSSPKLVGIEHSLDFVYGLDFEGVTIRPMQLRSELRELVTKVEQERPATVLEIGTATGGTLFLLTRVARGDATLISVDLPGGAFGGGYAPFREPLYRSFARRDQRLELLRGDSHRPETRDAVERALGGRRVDFLLIDGDHTLDGVRADFAMYAPLVAEAGLVAFHDIVPGESAAVGGVPEFWQELKADGDTSEIVESWGQGGYGIGLWRPAAGSGR